MTTTQTLTPAPTPAPAPVLRSGIAPVRLVKAELLKIWTTNSWWIFLIISVAFTALALLINVFQADSEIGFAQEQRNQPVPDFGMPIGPDGQPLPPEQGGATEADIQRWKDEYFASIDIGRIAVRAAAAIFTSGQLFGLLLMVILGVLVVTNEFMHQTATTTFLTTPRRTAVIISKLVAASLIAVAFWALTTLINLGVGTLFFSSLDESVALGEWSIVRSVLMNLLAYVVWAVLGVGLGVLIRSQLGATLTGAVFYLVGFPVAFILFNLIYELWIKKEWVWNWIAAVPGVASQIMISPERIPFSYGPNGPILGPPWWVGALVLVGYGVLAGVVGTLITRRRDIS